jgi:hypothetical protein
LKSALKNLAQSIGSNLMGSVENLDYIDDSNNRNHGTSRDLKINESKKESSSKL